MATVGNTYSTTGWYTPTYYNTRTASDWATGKNTRPDNYTKDELREHYDFVYNEPVSKMRPDKPLPKDAESQRYDWVFNIRSDEGRWQLHNPNGLNADRVGLSPYDWEGSKTVSSKTRSVKSDVKNESFDAAFDSAVKAVSQRTAPAARTAEPAATKTAAEAAEAVESLKLNNANRNSMLQEALRFYGTTGKAARITGDTLLSLTEEDDKKAAAV